MTALRRRLRRSRGWFRDTRPAREPRTAATVARVAKRGGATERTGDDRFRWFHQMLGTFPTGRLIDLGSGHGLFAQAAADLRAGR